MCQLLVDLGKKKKKNLKDLDLKYYPTSKDDNVDTHLLTWKSVSIQINTFISTYTLKHTCVHKVKKNPRQ